MDRHSYFQGWRLTCLISATISLAAVALVAAIGGSDGARLAVRFTARTSMILFLAAFTASALYRFLPSRFTNWLRINRRYIGVAFAGSHLVHALAIAAYIRADATSFHASQQTIGYILNGIGYAYIIAMTATSFRRTATVIGPEAWRWLHLTGSYYIWFAFAKSYFPRAAMDAFYIPFAVVLLVALIVRLAATFNADRIWATSTR